MRSVSKGPAPLLLQGVHEEPQTQAKGKQRFSREEWQTFLHSEAGINYAYEHQQEPEVMEHLLSLEGQISRQKCREGCQRKRFPRQVVDL